MNTAISRESALHLEIDESRKRIKELETSLQSVTTELQNETGIQERFDALGEVCTSLERLDALGGSDLFWGEQADNVDTAAYISQLRERLDGFEQSIIALQEKHDQIRADIRKEHNRISINQEEILDLKEQEERRKYEFIIEREVTKQPFRPMIMPWSRQSDDEKRLRRFVTLAIVYSILIWLVVPLVHIPLPDHPEEVEIPERLAKLLKKEEPKPQPEKEQKDRAPSDKPTKTETKAARKKAERSGLLAFKDNFTDLMSEVSETNLGASADISNSGQKSTQAARNLVVAKTSNIGGINSASLSRNTGGVGKNMGSGIQFSRVESSIGIEADGADRPSGSSAPPRTDEEIQIIFDRYKGALYRIYQRELRKDPTLQGNIVLRITIGPDGSVTSCKVESTDIKSSTLAAKIVARVKRFKFGEKKGTSKMTILYPIDFLPAT